MARDRIFSIGFTFPGGAAEQFSLASDQSLLDADIIVFQPSLDPFYYSLETYQGKPLLSEDSSFRASEAFARWRAEMKAAFEAGKVIFVYLARPLELYAHTGQKQYSGTGRNQKVTNIVAPLSTYSAIPLELITRPSKGTGITLVQAASYLAPYWHDFSAMSHYEVTIEGKFTQTTLTTKDGSKIVGALVRRDRGALVLLPPVHYDEEQFTAYNEKEEEKYWNRKGVAFGNKLAAALVGAARAIQASSVATPPPQWAQQSIYRMPQEDHLQHEISALSQQLISIHDRKRELERQLAEEGSLRRLLYETGSGLEHAILEALRLLGFEAQGYRDSQSQFDCLFESSEGRFLGEAEAKDNRAVNIDKLSQLERNIQEDFARDDVSQYSKGVLFGNPQRLTPIENRTLTFTEKCISGAKRSGIALVLTSDLFKAARYSKESADAGYAKLCRDALATTKGEITAFPSPPTPEVTASLAEEPDHASG